MVAIAVVFGSCCFRCVCSLVVHCVFAALVVCAAGAVLHVVAAPSLIRQNNEEASPIDKKATRAGTYKAENNKQRNQKQRSEKAEKQTSRAATQNNEKSREAKAKK